MLKISDEGLKDFEEEYKQIMLRKLKYGNAYNKNILAIEHKEIVQLIEEEIDNILNYPKKLKYLEDKIKKIYQMNGKFKFVEVEKSIRNIFVKIEQIRKNKNRYNNFFKEINKLIDDTNNVKNTKIKHIELENILLCEYNEMKQIISDMETLNNKKRMQELFKEFYTYTKYIDADLRDIILNKIGLNVCPYCGRQFISSYNDNGKIRNSADLDHFFSKDKYPYLALSLYNYVPSCHICNSKNKGNIDFNKEEHLYPYIEGFEADAKFDIDHSTLITDIISGKEKAKILIHYPEDNTKIKNNIKTFKLESLYKNHSKDVQKIFSMIQIYSQSYLKDIANLLYVKDDFSDRVSEIEDKISGIQRIKSSEKDELKDKLNKLREIDMAMKAEDLMLLLFKEKDNDEILSKLYNDLLDKYWRMM